MNYTDDNHELNALRKRVEELEHIEAEHRRTESELKKRTVQLAERVKELNCLYGISDILEKSGISLDDMLQDVANLIPSGWHYPEIAAARIQIAEHEYVSPGFRLTPWTIQSPITFRGETLGMLQVVYLEEKPALDEGPFFKEERNLIDDIAERLGRVIERRRTRQELSESERRYHSLVDNIPIAVFRTTPGNEGRLLMANPKMARVFGYDCVDDIINIRACDLYQDPAQRGIFSESLITKGDVVGEELDMKKRDGTPLRVSINARVIRNEFGAIEYFDCWLEDVTDRDRAEQERLMLEEQLRNTLIDGIVTVGENLTILSLNDAAARIFHVSQQEAESRILSELCVEELQPIAETVKNALETGNFIRDSQFDVAYRGKDCTYSISVTPLKTSTRRRGILVIRDITRLSILERQVSGQFPVSNMVGKSPAIQKVFNLIQNVADTNTTVLIEGESGTGKELVASALHHQSLRRNGPFVRVNCVALPETLLESELFGHVRGAFTGANRDRPGRFELANGGTIFLDEIGDISPAMQQHLLRVLQEREIERVGSTQPIKIDVRVVAATNRNLADLVSRNIFREDLYYRLNVIRIHVPPLRERRQDIPLLAGHFLHLIQNRTGRGVKGILPETVDILLHYDWPGNIRQLENTLERAVVLSRDGFIHPDNLPQEIREQAPENFVADNVENGKSLDAERIQNALNSVGWNRSRAAELLGISRSTLWRLMKKHEL